MPTHVIAGASRGLGLEFLRQYSLDPNNTVFGLVRDMVSTQKRLDEANVKNVRLLQADLNDTKSLDQARAEIEKVSPSVDYLINNGAMLGTRSFYLAKYDDESGIMQDELAATFRTNVIGVVNTINAFLPLVRKSSIKKVITISSGMADVEVTNRYGVWEGAPYSISKAALNMTVAKYHAKYRDEGILFLALSPGIVDTGNDVEHPPESQLLHKWSAAYPDWKGPITSEESLTAMNTVIEMADVKNGYGGDFWSHFGNKHLL